MVHDRLEHGRFKQGHDTVSSHDIPDDAGAILRGGNSLAVSCIDADVSDASSVLLERGSHDLGLHANLPDAHLTLHAATNDALAVVCWGQGCYTVVVRVVDGVEETA